jgi:quercetin dioxygenase-like cupin family protein
VNQHGAQRVRVGSRADVLMPPGSVVTINPGEVHSSRVVGEDGK